MAGGEVGGVGGGCVKLCCHCASVLRGMSKQRWSMPFTLAGLWGIAAPASACVLDTCFTRLMSF